MENQNGADYCNSSSREAANIKYEIGWMSQPFIKWCRWSEGPKPNDGILCSPWIRMHTREGDPIETDRDKDTERERHEFDSISDV